MTGPIPPRVLITLLACGAILPLAAFGAAIPFEGGKKKTLNIVSFVIGLLAISGVGLVLYNYQ